MLLGGGNAVLDALVVGVRVGDGEHGRLGVYLGHIGNYTPVSRAVVIVAVERHGEAIGPACSTGVGGSGINVKEFGTDPIPPAHKHEDQSDEQSNSNKATNNTASNRSDIGFG